MPTRTLSIALVLALCAGSALAQAPAGPAPAASAPPSATQEEPRAEPLSDPALAEAMPRCAAVFSLVANPPRGLSVSANKQDAGALMRLTMLGTHAFLGNAPGLAAVKRERAAIESKLTLTQPAHQGKLMDAEFSGCVQVVNGHREYLMVKIKEAERR